MCFPGGIIFDQNSTPSLNEVLLRDGMSVDSLRGDYRNCVRGRVLNGG